MIISVFLEAFISVFQSPYLGFYFFICQNKT
uniref:Uncharacterized protein n=1 Tax=Rhizophora mucronata TaxID=61149 RepID=A0A2P2IUA7_RHIMU